MAPRKKTSKQQQQLSKAKKAKLEAFLQDFDSEVKTRVERLKERKNQLLKDVDNSFNMALIKLPKAVRTMNWLQHCRSDKPKSPDVNKVEREEEAAVVESVLAEVHTMPPKTVQKSSKKRTTAKAGSEDEENMVDQSTVKKGKSRKPPTSKKAKAVGKQKTPMTRSGRAPLVTPGGNNNNTLNSSRLMGTTPLITPRFDPRLPRTPAVRSVQHKERVYSMSVNGSPIATSSQDIVINVPVGNGECVQLLASQMDSVDLSSLDENALRSIRLLQNRLTALCGPHQP